jgi:hypothetical protein
VLGELRPTTGNVRLPNRAQLQSSLAARGLRGTASLSWTWTREPGSPFAPFLTGVDARGRTTFVTARGVTTALPVIRGLTLRPN